ncbi:hypothetical protein CCHR01_19559 [Colletotrichum chrysophilum]|uniref:Uncharacterized protein n=1 Tax=Colletotrichum chrysophilum TaxID=1836956 RepID=A0AAD8ZYD4_9PEZI|nr:hypothetical protein CCHR01_19559 [Colletotrichum chrysophilum]
MSYRRPHPCRLLDSRPRPPILSLTLICLGYSVSIQHAWLPIRRQPMPRVPPPINMGSCDTSLNSPNPPSVLVRPPVCFTPLPQDLAFLCRLANIHLTRLGPDVDSCSSLTRWLPLLRCLSITLLPSACLPALRR